MESFACDDDDGETDKFLCVLVSMKENKLWKRENYLIGNMKKKKKTNNFIIISDVIKKRR